MATHGEVSESGSDPFRWLSYTMIRELIERGVLSERCVANWE